MARKVANNPSGKYLRMNDEQVAREQAAFDRAVARQAAEDERRAAAGRAAMAAQAARRQPKG
jgi:hypothetical protein